MEAELTLIYLNNPSDEVLDKIITSWASHPEPLLKYVLLHPFKITKAHLLPVVSNPLVAQLVPPQTYLTFGSQDQLDIDSDIECEQAILLVEHDQDYMRIDKFDSMREIVEAFSSGTGNPLIYKYQLAETFMRQVAFKLGKLEKFGA